MAFCDAARHRGAPPPDAVKVRAIFADSHEHGSYLSPPDRESEKCDTIIRIRRTDDASGRILSAAEEQANDANRTGTRAMRPEVDVVGTLGTDRDGLSNITLAHVDATRLVSARERGLMAWELWLPDGVIAHPERVKQ